jgi:hypothetical protein
MQTVVQIACTKGSSLRDAIANDAKLADRGFKVLEQKKQGRAPGWTKIRSNEGHTGTINVEWNAVTHFLTCRIINKGTGSPDEVIGAFIGYILERHKRRLKLITIWID